MAQSNKLRVLLVFPSPTVSYGDPPLGLAFIAGRLLKGMDVDIRILDLRLHPSLEYARSQFRSFQPHIAGIYVDTVSYRSGTVIAMIARQNKALVVIGGPHACVMPETLIEHADVLAVGEGEETFYELVKAYGEGDLGEISGIWWKRYSREVVKNQPRRALPDIDTLEPAWQLLEMEEYIKRWHYLDCFSMDLRGSNLISSRGCPFGCSFCQPALNKIFGPVPRRHSPGYVMEQIRFLNLRYGINSVFFHDDYIKVDVSFLRELASLISRSGLEVYWGMNTRAGTMGKGFMEEMHKAGLRKLHIGAESSSYRVLRRIYDKRIVPEDVRTTVTEAVSSGIRCLGFFMLAAPSETILEMLGTIRFAVSLPFTEATFSLASPLPGTFLYESAARQYPQVLYQEYSRYNYHTSGGFRKSACYFWLLKCLQLGALLLFYGRPRRWKYLTAHFHSQTGTRKLARKVRRFFA